MSFCHSRFAFPLILAFLPLAAGTSGCALLTKSTPIVPRYFSPEVLEDTPSAGDGATSNLSVRMGLVGGGSYLKERMAYRDSEHEFGFYEDRRWTERPEAYVERALEHSLFETRGIHRSLSSTASTLTVDLIEFEEVRGASPRVRVRLAYALHDEKRVIRERSFVVEKALASGDADSHPDRVAAGLGDALREAVGKVADEVVGQLRNEEGAAVGTPGGRPRRSQAYVPPRPTVRPTEEGHATGPFVWPMPGRPPSRRVSAAGLLRGGGAFLRTTSLGGAADLTSWRGAGAGAVSW